MPSSIRSASTPSSASRPISGTKWLPRFVRVAERFPADPHQQDQEAGPAPGALGDRRSDLVEARSALWLPTLHRGRCQRDQCRVRAGRPGPAARRRLSGQGDARGHHSERGARILVPSTDFARGRRPPPGRAGPGHGGAGGRGRTTQVRPTTGESFRRPGPLDHLPAAGRPSGVGDPWPPDHRPRRPSRSRGSCCDSPTSSSAPPDCRPTRRRRFVISPTKVLDGTVVLDPRRVSREGDEEVIVRLSTVRGIGRWTAEMFLMFQLRRLDVWPTGDLGVRSGFGLAWHIPMPTARQLNPLGDPFRPVPVGHGLVLLAGGRVVRRGRRERPDPLARGRGTIQRSTRGALRGRVSAADPYPPFAGLDLSVLRRRPVRPTATGRRSRRAAGRLLGDDCRSRVAQGRPSPSGSSTTTAIWPAWPEPSTEPTPTRSGSGLGTAVKTSGSSGPKPSSACPLRPRRRLPI